MDIDELKKYKFDTEVLLAICGDPSARKKLMDRLDAINVEIEEIEKERNKDEHCYHVQ